jgi:transmembrane sensor
MPGPMGRQQGTRTVSDREDSIMDAAAMWIVRSRDPRFSDWEGLTAWLESDPAHNDAYEAAFAAHDATRDLTPRPLAAPEQRVRPRWQKWTAIGAPFAAAAAAVAIVGVPQFGPTVETVIATRAGEQRTVHLADGTTIRLNGSSRLVLNGHNGRTARLDGGEAMFSVVHDEERPFTVDVGDQRLVDIGTRFDVIRSAKSSQVAVAEGAVLYDPNGAAVRLNAGRMLHKRDDSELVEVSDVQPAEVGTWTAGRLVYRAAPLAQVAEDLGRMTGNRIKVAPAIAARPFTGAIVVDRRAPDQAMMRVAKLLDVDFSGRMHDWYLSSRTGAGR